MLTREELKTLVGLVLDVDDETAYHAICGVINHGLNEWGRVNFMRTAWKHDTRFSQAVKNAGDKLLWELMKSGEKDGKIPLIRRLRYLGPSFGEGANQRWDVDLKSAKEFVETYFNEWIRPYNG